MTRLEIDLFQANAHRQYLSVLHLGPLGPLLRPMGQMSLMKAVSGRNLTLCLRSSVLVGKRASYSPGNEAGSQGYYT